VEVLNAIYETDFLGFSYGFRPGRNPHNALDALYAGLLTEQVNWVLDADIRGFFEAINHAWLVKFVEHRIADQRVVRLIQKWLNAGVRENGARTRGEEGTPQGAASRRSWPTCTCPTCATSGLSGGGRRRPAAT
jgi:RNA-directed DNA polymerase